MGSHHEIGHIAGQPSRLSVEAGTNRAVEIERLYARLTDGYQRIEEALAHGEDVTAWEDFWIALLHQYEALCDEAGNDFAKAS